MPNSQKMKDGGLVLVVDDQPIVRNVARILLEMLGFRVITACGGIEAIEIFRASEDEITLVLLDFAMPGMNGWQTLEAIRILCPNTPVVLSSGYDETQVMTGDHAERPQAFLSKPYSKATLEDSLRQAFNESGPK